MRPLEIQIIRSSLIGKPIKVSYTDVTRKSEFFRESKQVGYDFKVVKIIV